MTRPQPPLQSREHLVYAACGNDAFRLSGRLSETLFTCLESADASSVTWIYNRTRGHDMPRQKSRGVDPAVGRLIGWREWIRFPDLGIDAIKAKVDTGARTSSLHAFDVIETVRDGVPFICFNVHPEQRKSEPTIGVELPLVGKRRVRDSGGKSELRPVVKMKIQLLGDEWPIEVTLTRRDVMGFRMLLGRQAIRGRFVVDPGRSFFGGRRLKPRKHSSKGRD